MQMEAVKAALKDLLQAMDSEDKRVLQAKLSGDAPKPEVEVEVENDGAPCEKCGGECSCGMKDSEEE